MSDTEIEMPDEYIMPTKKMFPSYKDACIQGSLLPSDVNGLLDSTAKLFAVTVNIKPNKVFSKKPWHKYDKDKQRGLLARMELALRKKTPSIELVRIEYEECPKIKNIHFHAMYSMPSEFVSEMECHWEKHSGNLPDTKVPWRVIQIKPIHNEAGWIDYITKTLTDDN